MTETINKTDPRLLPARSDIASASLKGKVRADRFVEALLCTVTTSLAPLHSSPDLTSQLSSQLLYGDEFDELEKKNGWSWGQGLRDGYVGYVPTESLTSITLTPNFLVSVPATHIYEAPDLKSPIRSWLPMGASLSIEEKSERAGYMELENQGWVFFDHLQPLSHKSDMVHTATTLLGSPYLWGGCSSRGLDCSALIQIIARMAGQRIPRDTDLQEQSVGVELTGSSGTAPEGLQRGDLVFFPGHVGIMETDVKIIHANAYHMKTVVESLEVVIKRLAQQYEEPITSVRRLKF